MTRVELSLRGLCSATLNNDTFICSVVFVSACRYGFTFLGLESKTMKILNNNNDIEK